MKHKAKSFIAVLLALCLMMSLGVGALAVDGPEGGNPSPVIPDGSGNLPEPKPEPEPGAGTKYPIVVMYTSDTQSTEQGTVEVDKDRAAAGDEVTITVTPKTGYRLDYLNILKMGGGSVDYTNNGDGKYTFEMPAFDSDTSNAQVWIVPIFEQVYTITVNPSEHGKVTASPTEAPKQGRITLTVTADSGYELDSLTVTGDSGAVQVTANKYFNMPDSDVTVTATFKLDTATSSGHTITVRQNEGGTVAVTNVTPGADGKYTATQGTPVSFTATPDEGYEVVGPRGYNGVTDGAIREVSAGTTADATMFGFMMPDKDVEIGAEFKEIGEPDTPKTYIINVDRNPENGGTVTVDKQTAQAGDTVTFTVEPADGYEIGTVVVAGASVLDKGEGKYSFEMPASSATIYVNFKAEVQYDITVDDDIANGRVTASADRAAKGTTVKLTAEPDDGYVLDKYIVTMDGGIPVLFTGDTFTMPDGDVTVTATFKLKQDQPDWSHWHKIDTWSNSVDGGISVGNDADMALAGSTVTFRVWHNYRYDYYDYDVYVLNDRTGNRVSLDYSAYYDEYSFTMPDDDVTIYVYFDYAGRYSITKDVEGDGSIYVRSSADHGDTVWIEAAPSAGQSLTSLRVFYGEPWAYGDKGYYGYWDEAEVKYSTYWDAYYFTMPADDVVVYARFTDGATVDAKVSSRYADKGDWVYITAYPDEGYEVDSVTVTDSLGRSVKVTELSYDYFLFTMPGTNVDVKVTFRVKDYDVFYDVSRGDWYYKAVRFVHEKGIMEGTGTHYFSPEADLSRGMLATILYRLEGSPAVSGYSGFADVADTAYYAKAVAWAKANGIVNGVTATAYEPDTAVTREELAAILCRYAAFKGKDTAISYDYLAGFSDANTSHVYARPALNWAVAYDIINGQGNGVLAPRATATRAEVAQVLMNYLEVFD